MPTDRAASRSSGLGQDPSDDGVEQPRHGVAARDPGDQRKGHRGGPEQHQRVLDGALGLLLEAALTGVPARPQGGAGTTRSRTGRSGAGRAGTTGVGVVGVRVGHGNGHGGPPRGTNGAEGGSGNGPADEAVAPRSAPVPRAADSATGTTVSITKAGSTRATSGISSRTGSRRTRASIRRRDRRRSASARRTSAAAGGVPDDAAVDSVVTSGWPAGPSSWRNVAITSASTFPRCRSAPARPSAEATGPSPTSPTASTDPATVEPAAAATARRSQQCAMSHSSSTDRPPAARRAVDGHAIGIVRPARSSTAVAAALVGPARAAATGPSSGERPGPGRGTTRSATATAAVAASSHGINGPIDGASVPIPERPTRPRPG